MTKAERRPSEAVWFEPLAAGVMLALALFVNRSIGSPWVWVLDIVACSGAALSYRYPRLGAILTGFSLAVWLPFGTIRVSASGLAFFINIFAASRKNLSWKAPLVLGMGGLAYLVLVRKAVVLPSARLTTTLVLLIILILAYGGGLAFRYATQRIKREQESGQKRLQDLQVSLARELHDSVAQTLSSAAMRANIAMSDPGVSPLTRDHLERIADECRSSAHDLRLLLSSLRDEPGRQIATGPLADLDSLRQAVEDQADRLSAEGFNVTTDIRIDKLSAARCQTLAAIAVEAANNVMKHARPRSRCSISMVADDNEVLAEFTNIRKNTKGVHQGFGLTGIQERLSILDGSYSVTRAGGQWVLQARLPLGVEGSGNSSGVPSTPVPPPSVPLISPFARPSAVEHEGSAEPATYKL